MNNKLYIVYIILLSVLTDLMPFSIAAQKSSKAAPLCEKAKKAMQLQDFTKAMGYLNQAQSKDPGFADIYIMKGDIFNFTLHSDSAMLNYQRAIDIIGDPDPMLYYIAGNEGAKCGEYAYALKTLQHFLQTGLQYPDILPDAQKTIANCKFAIEAMKNPMRYELVNLGLNINSEWDEYLAAITADDEQIVFTVKRPRDQGTICAFCLNEEDLYASRKAMGEWLPREALTAPVKSGYNEGAQCLSPDGKYLLYTMCDADFGMGSCDLYWAKRIGDRWSRPRNFGAPVNSSSWESQPSMAADGMTVYFASSRPGGFGGMDIWKTTMTAEGEFSIPENLGPAINTPGDDAAPFIHSDGRTLYFASNGRVGMGGLTTAEQMASKPEPVAYPNTRIPVRHYGRALFELFDTLKTMEPGEERDTLVRMTANQMKRCLLLWGHGNGDDEKVADDLARFTDGVIQLDLDSFRFDKIDVQSIAQQAKLKKQKKK